MQNNMSVEASLNKLREAVLGRNDKKRLLSASVNGLQIKVVATATPGTLIHTARRETALDFFDEVYLYAVNSSGAGVKLTVEWGTATAPDGNIEVTIPAESGYTLVVPGMLLQNSKTVRAFAGSANVILINGYIKKL